MNTWKAINSFLFSRYDDSDLFTRSSAKFLFTISFIFFVFMFVLLFITIPQIGFIRSFITCGTSCISACITMLLLYKGKFKAAASFLVIIQTVIIIASTFTRSTALSLVTTIYFAFPTIILCLVFASRWLHSVTIIILIGLLISLGLRYDPATTIATTETISSLVYRGIASGTLTLLLTFTLAYVAMRSLKLSLALSQKEAETNREKNEHITRLLDTIRNSYIELTKTIQTTDTAVSSLFINMQTEAATVEELAASMEEISSNTTNVDQATLDQNESVIELGRCITSLSEQIDSLQVFGSDLQHEFTGITAMSTTGSDASQSLDEINKKILANSNDIRSITDIIDEFFDKINLLSLNAAIEAARAGDQGRGFAVVADEISKLADSSSSELNKIKDLIEKNRFDVENANSIIEKIITFIESLGTSLTSIQGKAIETLKVISAQNELKNEMISKTDLVRDRSDIIKNATAEQTVAIQEVVKSIESTNALVQDVNNTTQTMKDNYETLKRLAEELNNTIEGNS
ncbi:MAG TPA: methyl-accepting chemotaxis protein [Spirochaetota bacterium]|nr:methyl-accepting chemotaxis protein [Spirochaetota bacterium]